MRTSFSITCSISELRKMKEKKKKRREPVQTIGTSATGPSFLPPIQKAACRTPAAGNLQARVQALVEEEVQAHWFVRV
jgi:hypothetical protein